MEDIENVWFNLELYIGYEVPVCLKMLLWKCGYDSMFSVKQICDERIQELEKFIQEKRTEIFPLLNEDNDISLYKKQKTFEFLPGHRNILLHLSQNINSMQAENSSLANTDANNISSNGLNAEFSTILTKLVNTAKKNENKTKSAYQYDDTIKYFSTYIF